MKIGEWFQINELHDVGENDKVLSIFELYFKLFYIALVKDKYGLQLYFKLFCIKFFIQQNKKERRKT